jgi:hypothetical protein
MYNAAYSHMDTIVCIFTPSMHSGME